MDKTETGGVNTEIICFKLLENCNLKNKGKWGEKVWCYSLADHKFMFRPAIGPCDSAREEGSVSQLQLDAQRCLDDHQMEQSMHTCTHRHSQKGRL